MLSENVLNLVKFFYFLTGSSKQIGQLLGRPQSHSATKTVEILLLKDASQLLSDYKLASRNCNFIFNSCNGLQIGYSQGTLLFHNPSTTYLICSIQKCTKIHGKTSSDTVFIISWMMFLVRFTATVNNLPLCFPPQKKTLKLIHSFKIVATKASILIQTREVKLFGCGFFVGSQIQALHCH